MLSLLHSDALRTRDQLFGQLAVHSKISEKPQHTGVFGKRLRLRSMRELQSAIRVAPLALWLFLKQLLCCSLASR
jgi:hypothetical protein